jgi:hypothetical protein
VNWRLDLVRLVIDGQSEGHGVTPINLSTKPGEPRSYEEDRRAICSCAAALNEIGYPESQAVELLQWPTIKCPVLTT